MSLALGSVDAHLDGVVAEVRAEIKENRRLLDLLAGAISDDFGCLVGKGEN